MPTKAFSQAKLLGTDNTISVTSLSADIPITEKFTSAAQLPPTGTIGEQAFVEETNRLYIWNGSGWYNIALINTTPNITSSHDSSYTLSYGAPLNINVDATDPEGVNLTYDFSTSDSIGNVATIANDSSQFTITPSSNYAVEGTFGLVFRASDGVNIATAGTSTFTLANQAPSLSGNSASYQLAADGTTTTVITLVAVDPEGQPITYTATGDSGFNSIATVAQGTGEGYAIASASILSGTYTIGAYLAGLTFKPDGTKMYTISTNTDRVSQYDLSTAWDVSTAAYDDNFSVQSQVLNLTDVKFNTDGTKMFVADRAGTTDNTIYQYSLSTAWDITTATYANKSYDFSAVLTGDELSCFVFNSDGSAVYLAELGPDRSVFQFTLSTSFDISTASYSNKSLSLSSVSSNSYIGRQYFQFTNDGTKLFLIHTFHPAGFVGKIYEFSLTTAYDISTASYTNVNYTPSGITTGRSAIAFKSDGSKMFILGTDNHTTISQFNLPVYNTNTFITTPKTEAQAPGGGTGNLTFTASDGIKSTNAASSFTLTFVGDWSSATQQAKIVASDAAAGDRYGHSVSISEDGNTAIVGAHYADPSALSNAGAAYIYTRSGTTWSQQAKLLASNVGAGDRFGTSVDISSDGNTIVAGANYEDTSGSNTGAAYIFTRSGSTWSQQTMLKASDAEADDWFGESVSISDDGNTVIVGAKYEDIDNPGGIWQSGAAYIFTRSGSTWSQQAKIVSSDLEADDRFGTSVSISGDGDNVIVGASQEDTSGTNAGSAYIFTRSGSIWSQQAKIQSSDIQANDGFGGFVSISEDGNTAIIGAPYEDTSTSNIGAAYIFTRSGSTWSQQAKIQTSDSNATTGGNFGQGVSISNNGNIVVVSHPGYEIFASNDEGAVHIFTRSGTTWTEQITLQASDAQDNDMLSVNGGVAISGDGETVIAGAEFEDTGGTDAGAAYIFVAG